MNVAGLSQQIEEKKNFLCVGLDTDPDKLPSHLSRDARGMMLFNRSIVSATAPYCVGYKINLAFYEAMGSAGWSVFEETVQFIRNTVPNSFIIADAKRGDIGNTADRYARAFFEHAGVDALTIAPYMGADSVEPFLAYRDKTTIVLGLTSNEGNRDFQQLDCGGKPLYQHVMEKCMGWAGPDQLMFVVGATHPESMKSLRSITGEYFWLVPGVGAQGGSLSEVWNGRNSETGLLVNSSRDIIYSSSSTNFDFAAREKAQHLSEQMRALMEARA